MDTDDLTLHGLLYLIHDTQSTGHVKRLAEISAGRPKKIRGDTALARRDAEIRGKALREVAAHIYNGEMSRSELAKWCRDQDQDGRRQAEASDQAERTPNSGL